MSNYGENYYLEELEEMKKEKVVTIIPDKQIIIDKSDLDLIHKQYKDKISDLETKLAETKKALNTISAKHEKKSEQIFEIIKNREECSNAYNLLSEENYRLKQQLAEKDSEVQSWKDGTMVVKLGKLEEQLAEKEKECAIWERAYEYAIFECDFYKNHTQTTNEETMKRIEQLYEKILKRAKLLMGDK